jgi:secondary thiamine-phosphate synthase enzyme
MECISVKTNRRIEMIDITHLVNEVISKAGRPEGVCTVYCPHTTAGLTINENADPDVVHDILMKLNSLIPAHEGYRHLEGNADAHIKSTLVGQSVQLIIAHNKLQLGTWQGVYFCEFDGPRHRNIWIQVT